MLIDALLFNLGRLITIRNSVIILLDPVDNKREQFFRVKCVFRVCILKLKVLVDEFTEQGEVLLRIVLSDEREVVCEQSEQIVHWNWLQYFNSFEVVRKRTQAQFELFPDLFLVAEQQSSEDKLVTVEFF